MTQVFWTGTVPLVDDFSKIIQTEFIDGKTTFGPWAYMTPESFKKYGIGLGQGRGQRYVVQENGKWLKVEG
jgi:hypothetical protein